MPEPLDSYDAAWSALNTRLRQAEAGGGLGAAIAALEANQRDTGFIRDLLTDVERHTFHHPVDPARELRVQFNPQRLKRFNSSRVSAPPDGIVALHGGCFLCRENVRWQQEGAELGFTLDLGDRPYVAWMNPFPLAPGHAVVASAAHETQDWQYGPDGGQPVARLTADLADLAVRTPGHVGFHNGVNAGASIAGHLHYQFFHRPADTPDFPLEARLADLWPTNGTTDDPVICSDYPVPVVAWRGPAAATAAAAAAWIDDWADRNAARIDRLAGNIIATARGDAGDHGIALYFVPRDRTKLRGDGLVGMVGGLEVMGELVFSTAEEHRLLTGGAFDYFTIEHILGAVRTPLFTDETETEPLGYGIAND